MAARKKKLGQAVLVTTEHRGVFFGYLVGEPSKERVLLQKARNCLYEERAGIPRTRHGRSGKPVPRGAGCAGVDAF